MLRHDAGPDRRVTKGCACSTSDPASGDTNTAWRLFASTVYQEPTVFGRCIVSLLDDIEQLPLKPRRLLSGLPQKHGWTVMNTARAFDRLMVNVLGYKKYAVQGGDWVRFTIIQHTPIGKKLISCFSGFICSTRFSRTALRQRNFRACQFRISSSRL